MTRVFNLLAPAYDSPLLQQSFHRLPHAEVVALLSAHEPRRIADIGCGTGILTERIANEVHPEEIYGIDVSAGMLDQARARTDRVKWMRWPAEQLPLDGGVLDAIVTTSAFHFFNRPVALREIHRVLTPGGLVVVAAPCARQVLPRVRGVKPRTSQRNPSPDALRSMFADAGLRVIDQRRIPRPPWTRIVFDFITAGLKP